MSRLSLKIAVQSFLLVYLLKSVVLSNSNFGVGSLKTKCIDEERRALLKFKDNLESYDNGTLSSWGYDEEKKDCCSWEGVGCDNITGHVIILDLSHLSLRSRGKYMSPPVIELRYWNYLDLSGINLSRNNLSSLIGNSMVSLQHLDLSETRLEGLTPEIFWSNMTSLSHLILYSNSLGGSIPQGFCNVASLRYLDLSGNGFIGSIPKCLGNMTLLEHLDLCHNDLVGSIPEAFGNLVTLTYLDLSTNHLNDSIPKFLGNMTLLKFLDLHHNSFNGSVPKAFGNMATLTYLDLGMNYLKGSNLITFENLSSTLTHLALDSNQLEGVIPNSFAKKLTSLVFLDLSNNKLEGSIPECFGKNLTSLAYLDLSKNKLESSIPECFSKNMMLLTYLALGDNQLEGPIPEAFGNISALEQLDLENNKLAGEIPKSIWNICTLRELFLNSNNLSGQLLELTQSSSSCTNHSFRRLILRDNRITGLFPSLRLFSSLESLDISSNQLSGSVDPSIGQLSELVFLNISNNLLEGVISEAHFSKLSKLNHLDFSMNKLIFNVSYAWVPPFILDTICLSSCMLGPKFPRWLQTQDVYSWLDVSNTGVSDSIPSWFWVHRTLIDSVNVSNNQLSGMIGNYSTFPANAIDLSSNQLEGAVPMFLFKDATVLSLSRNKFSSISSTCDVVDVQLKVLDISHNQLSGKLSNCWSQFNNLVVINLANNYELSGEIPTSIGSLTNIHSLRLANNKFTGELPLSLKVCKNLRVFDVGGNKLSGAIPTWIGEALQYLVILNLRSNHLYGNIPSSLCHLSDIQLLDLSINNISGSIPKCLNNFSEMRSSYTANTSKTIEHFYYTFNLHEGSVGATYVDRIEVMWKGFVSEYGNTLGLVKGIDLSTNMLNGEIPPEITELVGLIYFNLSRNNLSGQIPAEIGNLKSLDFLDLSDNQFSGQIPPSLRLIDRLSLLNLSNNNLSGKIPTSTQLQSFNADAYTGNVGLCGALLPKKCPGEEEQPSAPSESTEKEYQKDELMSDGYYVSIGIGYAVGFWGVVGTLLFNKSYCKLLNDFTNWIYVMAAFHMQKFQRTLQGCRAWMEGPKFAIISQILGLTVLHILSISRYFCVVGM